MRRIALLVMILILGGAHPSHAQTSLNMTVFGTLDPVPIRYSGSWGYTAPGGEEYALLGCNTGVSIIAIDDPGNIHEVAFIPGPTSNWHEIVAFGDYAYVVSEGASPGPAGMQIIDLSQLPVAAPLVTTYNATFGTAHMIQRDIDNPDPYIYVMGTAATGGIHILDISTPTAPVEVGVWAPYYIHDAHIRGDRAYAAAIFNGTLDIVDLSDRSNPTDLTNLNYPSAFTHSSFTTADANYLFVTDETDGLPGRMWDISNEAAPVAVGEYTANSQSLVHNPYRVGDLMVLSHNTEGVRVLDVADPELMVEVGFYDTWLGASGGFHGLWSAYPWFPSGKIIGGNREDGLWIWEFDGTRAARLYGTVTDASNGAPIEGATVFIVDTGNATSTAADGTYAIGDLPSDPGGYTLMVGATGYVTQQFAGFVLASGAQEILDVALDPIVVGVDDVGTATALRLELDANSPNPFNPYTTIRFRLDGGGGVSLDVFDARGTHVTRLVDGHRAAGEHSVVWDGTDARGTRVASGTYFYRLEAAGASQTRKMVLSR